IGAAVNPVQLLGPTAPVALAEAQAIALKHLGRAEARVQSLGQELLGLAEEATATVVPAESIPAAPAPSAEASEAPAAPANAGGAAGSEVAHGGAAVDSSDAADSGDAVAGAPTEAAAKAVAGQRPSWAPRTCGAAPHRVRASTAPASFSGPTGRPGWNCPDWPISRQWARRSRWTKYIPETWRWGMGTRRLSSSMYS